MNDLCEIHKKDIAVSRCIKCSRNMCSRCLKSRASFCPKCTGISITKIEKKESKYKIRNIVLFGLLFFLLSIAINKLSDNAEIMQTKDILINSILFFFLGNSFASAFYFLRDTNIYEDLINEIPFFGKKLVRYLFIGSSVLGIPLIYFFILIYKYFKLKNHQ